MASKWKLLHFIPSALGIAGLIIISSATIYFGSPPEVAPRPSPGSSSTVCYPVNSGLNEACVVSITDNLSVSASLSGAVTNIGWAALGETIHNIGQLLEYLSIIGFIAQFLLWGAKRMGVTAHLQFGGRLPIRHKFNKFGNVR